MRKRILAWIGGFLVGFGLCLMIFTCPGGQKKYWINPDSGYLVWAEKQPSGEYISLEK